MSHKPEPTAQWSDPRVQQVYALLCDIKDVPTDGQHWEGWVARRIVDAIAAPAAQEANTSQCERMAAALKLAANRLSRLSLEVDDATRLHYEAKEWARQAEKAAQEAETLCGKCGHPELCAAMGCKEQRAAQEAETPSWKALPYSTPLELWRAFKTGVRFVLHYHGRPMPVERMEPREHIVYVQPPGLPVKIKPDGSSGEGPCDIWLEQRAAQEERQHKTAADRELAAFERWVDRERPSGDAEAVQRAWLESDAYADLQDDEEGAQEVRQEPVAGLPERDHTKPAEQQGLFRKFEVRRTDGSDATPMGKHYGCEYFVLDINHDPHAAAALSAYADAVEATHPALAADMRSRYALAAAPQPPQPEPSTWSTYVAGMVGGYLGWPVDDERIDAVAGIIERRRCADAQPPQPAAPLDRPALLALFDAYADASADGVFDDEARRVAGEIVAALTGVEQPAHPALPPEYMLAKLAMVVPLLQEARDALPAITEQQRKAHGISPTLAERMDIAGTYSLDDWRLANGIGAAAEQKG